jgi:hypothetical protein
MRPQIELQSPLGNTSQPRLLFDWAGYHIHLDFALRLAQARR